jgi:DNA-binding transcriptional LysR family regulator
MELYQLKSFLTIAYEKNLTRAAEALHLSQSALSSQIKLLEEDLGVSLFSRTSRGMAITDQGRILMTHAQDVLETASQLQKRAEEMSRGITATVSIGLNTDPGFLRISATNQRLNRLHNDTNIIFHLCQSADTPQKLRHGQIDLGFFYGENKDTDIEAVIIRQVRTCVVIPNKFNQEGKDLAWQEVAELPWIWVDNNIPFFKLLQSKIRNYRKLPNQLVTAVDEQIVRELVAAGQGVAIMRDDEARALAENGQVSIWSRGWGEIPLCLGWMAGRGKEKSIQDAREVIEYVWRRPTTATDGSLTDKCWA